MKDKEIKIEPIKTELRPLLDEFLKTETYQAKFKEIAEAYGYAGNDVEKIHISLFIPDVDTNNICFVNQELYEMFYKFQIHKEVNSNPNFTLLCKLLPERVPFIEDFMYKMLIGAEVDKDEVTLINEELKAKLADMPINETDQISE